ncbi:LppU/SCO3897 family protein [Actinomadura parmotrematis]|uniref:Septum formation-related domain-containing protein n=1 Tax=Actinomadura parmotrematis TaxID=2864039 RepID=A0ABS7FPK6_9ACTN|nr:hypothetical protein [Actinomadura parmotrematis]MBW8482302.1 hypothetical protein [Actinomadura parmotrematis]
MAYAQQQGYPPPPAPAKRSSGRRWLVVLAVIVVLIGGLVALGAWASQGSPDSAKAGDCVARPGADDLKVVKCTDASAAFKVLGRVDDKYKYQFDQDSKTLCAPYQGTRSAFWRGESGKQGYVLCLGPVG